MSSQPVARIFLSEQRRVEQTESFRIHYTNLQLVEHDDEYVKIQDVTLGNKARLEQPLPCKSTGIIIPLIGSVGFLDDGQVSTLPVGEVCLLSKDMDTKFSLTNPYAKDLISFLLIQFPNNLGSTQKSFALLIDQQPNTLQSFFQSPTTDLEVYMGKYEGRQSGNLSTSTNQRIYVFVIGGAFEVQNRLLHERDGLVLSNVDQLEFEALSKEGILLVIKY